MIHTHSTNKQAKMIPVVVLFEFPTPHIYHSTPPTSELQGYDRPTKK